MQRIFSLAWFILILVSSLTVLAAEPAPVVSSPPVEVVDETRYTQEAQAAWKNVVDKSNPRYLDQHMGQFPAADTARTAFSLRYELVRNSQSIATYNAFIARYPDRAATPQAVGEVWQLYRADNRLSGYLDFIRRYPNTSHAVVAKYHAQQLAFEYAVDFDTVTDYDAFLEAFPDAPQLEAVRLKAATRAKADEEALYEAEKKQRQTAEFEQRVVKRARNLVAQYLRLNDVVSTTTPDPLHIQALVTKGELPTGTTQVDNLLRRNLGLRMERIYYTLKLFEPYHEDDEVLRLIHEEQRQKEIMAQLRDINANLVLSNTKLIDTLKQEFGQTREVLRQGFEAVVKGQEDTRRALEAGFQRLEVSMNQLHEDLVTIHGDLVAIHHTVGDISANIRRANQYLAQLDQDLGNVTQSLQSINRDMNTGFKVGEELTRKLTQEVSTGFQRQEAVSQQILVVNREHLDTSRKILDTNKDQLDVVKAIRDISRDHLDVSAQNLDVNTKHLAVGQANLAVNQSQLEVAQVNLQTSQHLVKVAESHRDISSEHLVTAKEHVEIGQRQLQTAQENLATSGQILTTNRAQLAQETQQVVLQMRGVRASEAGLAAMRAGYTPLARTTWNAPSEGQQTNLAMLARVAAVAAARQGGSQRQGQPGGLEYFLNLGMDKALQARCPECREELAAFRRLRRDLALWTAPSETARSAASPAPRVWRRVAWAASLFLAAGAVLGGVGTDVHYGDGSLTLRFGRARRPAEDRPLVQEARQRQEVEALKAALAGAAPRDDQAVLNSVRQMIRESEARQALAWNAALVDFSERSDAQRRYDLAQVSAGLSYLDGKQGMQAARTTELMGHVLLASQKR